jgi:hypothetical protein
VENSPTWDGAEIRPPPETSGNSGAPAMQTRDHPAHGPLRLCLRRPRRAPAPAPRSSAPLQGYFFSLAARALCRNGFPNGDRRFVSAAAAPVRVLRGRTAREDFFLPCRVRTGGLPPPIFAPWAAWRTLVATVSGTAETLSANSLVTLVSVPAACPSLRATVLRRGSCVTVRFLAAIDTPHKSLCCESTAFPMLYKMKSRS